MSESKVIVVTGVSSGIGHATPEKFAGRGCQVFGTVRSIAKSPSLPGVMRRPPKDRALLLSKLRRYVPATLVDSALRKDFGLG